MVLCVHSCAVMVTLYLPTLFLISQAYCNNTVNSVGRDNHRENLILCVCVCGRDSPNNYGFILNIIALIFRFCLFPTFNKCSGHVMFSFCLNVSSTYQDVYPPSNKLQSLVFLWNLEELTEMSATSEASRMKWEN